MNSLNKRSKLLKRIRTLIIILLVVFGAFIAALMFFFYINMGPKNTSTYRGPRKVSIENKNGKYSFYKDGKPFFVKGGTGLDHIKELSETGGNTIMCWDTSKLESVFKEAALYNVAVIIGLDVPGERSGFYNNKRKIEDLYNAYIDVVTRYKNNPSLLAWCLGNEMTLPNSLTPGPFYKTYNRILDRIHNVDPNHPVSTSVLNITIGEILTLKWRMPALDFYSMNIYNSVKIMKHNLERTKWLWDGPYLVGEWAPEGGWEAPMTAWQAPIENSSTTKAQLFYEFFTKYMPVKDPRFMGSLVFYWGHRQEYTQSWFSIFSKNGYPNEIEEALNDCWKDTSTQHLSPKINFMLIDNLDGKSNIIVTGGSKHNALLEMQSSTRSDTLQYKWEIHKENWFYGMSPAEVGLFADSTLPVTDFRAPQKEGPYRVFITVYNSKGYFATANIPIYVIR
ncbi:hypothetical protein EFY79_07180 [Hanamia caeni]|uniref:Glycoside hydrolase family 2 catalytic domain-containing protein n=1 Tax=Hanamia caeni TaxID=2294116 RepID=A0A3M9NJM9_9BACT|nr:hypothetical protein [Hanamia caeni]RNI38006.1 hypothetical protein EFY79_07180 [Hanamia caeni]